MGFHKLVQFKEKMDESSKKNLWNWCLVQEAKISGVKSILALTQNIYKSQKYFGFDLNLFWIHKRASNSAIKISPWSNAMKRAGGNGAYFMSFHSGPPWEKR